MFFSSWIRRRTVKQAARPKRTARPSLEQLEDRCVPAIFNIPAGDLAGLRAAIDASVNNGQADTINIAPGTTSIDAGRGDNSNLTGDLDISIVDNQPITFVGQGATPEDTVLKADNNDRVFHILSGTVNIQQLTINDGMATDAGGGGGGALGGGILAATDVNLSLFSVILSGNVAEQGGAIFNAGNLTADVVTFVSNQAAGATGSDGAIPGAGSGGGGGAGAGGAIFNSGDLTIRKSRFDQNQATGGRGGNASAPTLNQFEVTGGDGGGPFPGSGGSPGQPGGSGILFSGGGGGGSSDNGTAPGGTGGEGGGGGGGGARTNGGAGGVGGSVSPDGTGGAGGRGDFSAAGGGGGGGGLGGAIAQFSGTLKVMDTTFTSNQAFGGTGGLGSFGGSGGGTMDGKPGVGLGGAVYVHPGTTGSVARSTFSGNSADIGGAIGSRGDFTTDGSTLTNNTARGLDAGGESFGGGAVYSAAQLTIRNSTLNSNTSGHYGGAVFSGGTLVLQNSTLADNHANDGGGALSDFHGVETFQILNATIVNNSANQGGGGIDAFGSTSITLGNSILAGNTSNGQPNQVGTGAGGQTAPAVTSLGGNISNSDVSGFGGSDKINTDPRLDPAGLRNNGGPAFTLPLNNLGPTFTIALLPDSPAINAGIDSLAFAASLFRDQRGFLYTRFSGTIDSGAYEVQSLLLTPLLLSDESDGTFTNADLSLREAYEQAQANPGPDTIELKDGQTYTLPNGLSPLTTPLTLHGNGATVRATGAGYRFARVAGAGNLALDGLTIRDFVQRGDSDGGAIRVESSGVLSVANSAFINNRTEGDTRAYGGAVALTADTTAASFVNTTFSGNAAFSGGGAIASDGTLTIVNCTITDNVADFTGTDAEVGGGIVKGIGTVFLLNTIVAGNRDGSPALNRPDVSGTFVSLGGNLIGAVDGATGFGAPSDRFGTAATPLDPLLGALADIGNTLGHSPIPGSPAIEAGNQGLADLLITPTSVTSLTAATDLIPAMGLIGNTGLSAVPTLANLSSVFHSQATGGNSWETTGSGEDYFASNLPNPELTFTLPSLALISDIVVWGIDLGGVPLNDEAKTLQVAFSTDGGTTFGPAITVEHARTTTHSERIALGGLFAANTVRVTITDNYFGAAGGIGGGLVGLGEVKFIQQLPATDQRGQARIQGAVADSGAVEVPVLFGDAFNRANGPSLGAPWVNRVGSVAVSSQNALGNTTKQNIATVAGRNHADVVVQAKVSLQGVGQTVGLVARYGGSGNSNYYSGVLVFPSGGSSFLAQIRKNVNGTVTNLASVPVLSGIGKLRLEVTGMRLNLYLNDVRVASVVDGSLKSGGVGVFTNGFASLDNFAAIPVLGSLPFSADFNKPDGTALDPQWTVSAGKFISQGNKLQGTTATNHGTLVGVSASDVTAQAGVAVPNTNGQFAGLVLRQTDTAGKSYYFGQIKRTSTGFVGSIVRSVNGTLTTLSSTSPAMLPQGITGTLRFQAAGHRLQLFIDDTLLVSAFDTTFGAGAVGVRASNPATLDNFSASLLTVDSVRFQDNFEQANGSPLSGSWTDRVGGYTVQNGAAVGTKTVNLTTLVGLNKMDAFVTATVSVTSVGQVADLLQRYSGPMDRNYYAGRLSRTAAGFVLSIVRNVNGVSTTLKSAPVASGSGEMIWGVIGSELFLVFDGTRIDVTDGTFTTGRVGFRSSAGVAVQNFRMDQVLKAATFSTDFPEAENSLLLIPSTHLGSYRVKSGAAVGQSALNLATSAAVVYTDVDLSIDVNLTAGQSAGLLARYRGAGDRDYYLAQLTRTATGFTATIIRNVGGTRTGLMTVSVTRPNGQGRLRFTALGSSLALFLDDVLIGTAVDFTWTSGAAGMLSTQGAHLDNLTITE